MRTFVVRTFIVTIGLCLLSVVGAAQEKPGSQVQAKYVTVPAIVDHNRIVVDADIPLPGGSSERVHTWIDSGNADLELSRRLATLLALNVSCDDKECTAPPPPVIVIGGMMIPLTGVKSPTFR